MKSVQQYIEDVPLWDDGSKLPSAPLSQMQWLVWFLSTAGKFFEGLIVFMSGIALPLVSEEFGLTASDKGFFTAATLFGILIGALFLGGAGDRFGRKPIFIGEMVLMLAALIVASVAPNAATLIGSLFVVGVALGADYPMAHLVISENIPAKIRGRLVLGAFSFQAVGVFLGTIIATVVLSWKPELQTWRAFYVIPMLPVALVIWGRCLIPESSLWLFQRGFEKKATYNLSRLLNRKTLKIVAQTKPVENNQPRSDLAGFGALFIPGRTLKATILASIPWFLQDLSTYGIGIFTPVIVGAAFGNKTNTHTVASIIHDDLLGARGASLVDIGFVIGIILAIFLADKWGRIPLQVIGFIGCSIGLFVATLGGSSGSNVTIIVIGFFLFQISTNFGPNAITYLLAGELFPTSVRGMGAGFAAASGKVGAVLTAFFFPVLLEDLGTGRLLPLLALTSILGAIITYLYRIEPNGRDLESV